MKNDPNYYTAREARETLECSRANVHKLEKSEKLRALRKGGRVYYLRDDVDALADEKARRRDATALKRRPAAATSTSDYGINADLLREERELRQRVEAMKQPQDDQADALGDLVKALQEDLRNREQAARPPVPRVVDDSKDWTDTVLVAITIAMLAGGVWAAHVRQLEQATMTVEERRVNELWCKIQNLEATDQELIEFFRGNADVKGDQVDTATLPGEMTTAEDARRRAEVLRLRWQQGDATLQERAEYLELAVGGLATPAAAKG